MRTISRTSGGWAWWLLPVAILLSGACLASQPAPPRLFVAAPAESPILLRKLRISAEITGGVALTTIEMVFYNPNRRALEGELQFPLLDGQQIVGFALDVDGKLRDAVAVEKSRGQQVFEDITRQGVDPGLLQVTQGNNFKLRVYPLFAQRTRTVAIRYSESLVNRGARGIYRLPLEYASRVGEFSLAVSVRGASARPSAAGLAFNAAGNGWEAKTALRDHAPKGMLQVNVALPPGVRVMTQRHEGSEYFYVDLPAGGARVARAIPATVGILWDSSGSGAARNHARELALLDLYFARLRNGEVRLTRIRDRADAPERFAIVDGDWSALRRALASTVYDGATNFGSVAADPAVGEYLLFSDGLGNYGAGSLPETRVPLYAISSTPQANPAWLRHAAHRSGGRHLDLVAETPRAAARKLLFDAERVLSVNSDGATQLIVAAPFASGGRIAVAGMLVEQAATVRVTLGLPGRAPRVIAVPVNGDASESPLAAAFWARARVEQLEADPAVNRAEILRTGRSFGLVTRETSLIVLEFTRDYVRFGIVPPKELMAEYERARQGMRVSVPDPRQKLEQVIAQLNQKEAWWKREFPKGSLPAPVEERHLRQRDDELSSARGATLEMRRESVAAKPASAPAMVQKSAAADAPVAGPAGFGGGATARQSWSADAPYAARLRSAEPSVAYRVYLDERPGYATSPAFYVDAADMLAAKGLPLLALRVLSNLAEIDLENRHLLRTLGNRLTQAGEAKLAVAQFKRVLDVSPEEPQSFRDLGLAYAAAGERQLAVDALHEVVVRPWHNRFPQIELIALADLNAIVASANGGIDVSRIDPRLLRNLPLDLRVVLTWDTDNTDVNLSVIDPNGQQAHAGGPITHQDGRMSMNFSGGYGPEEYSLRAAKPGKYRIAARLNSDRRQVVGAEPTQVHLRVYAKFGTAEQAERAYSVRLTRPGEALTIAEFVIPAEAGIHSFTSP